jgi:hypothetical protein
MDNCGKTLFGVIIGITAMLSIKMAYEYGRYSAIHEIYKRGWKVVVDDDQEESETTEK